MKRRYLSLAAGGVFLSAAMAVAGSVDVQAYTSTANDELYFRVYKVTGGVGYPPAEVELPDNGRNPTEPVLLYS